MKKQGMRKATLVVSLAVGSVLALAGNSTAAPAAQSLAESGSTKCDSFVNHGKKWTANCKVIRGQAAAWTECSDGTEVKGPFVGVGYWAFGGDCSGHGTVKHWKVLTR
ncbi:hypothetical protein [Streptomyces sp. BR123]|uniref:hypothetical protein n=1 Tax=Streptomyces sp. BR123 TaxID=2749828 RepID=UPI00211ABB17|nr:hypothetical protein [Streptomyces sp. BR123]